MRSRRFGKGFVLFAVFLAMVSAAMGAPSNDPVTREDDAAALYAQARQGLAALGLTIPRNIPLKFRSRDELMVENNANGGRTMELDGFYRPYNPEEIWIVSSQPRGRTLGTMAHEMTHAWQSDNAPLQDRKLKEGFARWVQFKVLLAGGYERQAHALTMSGDDDYRGGLLALLEIERQKGAAGVIQLARTAQKL